jgi:2-polyprenyl-3-methyl-5-hydroxy-6-metoxy-1,4-benzoquinol methylase
VILAHAQYPDFANPELLEKIPLHAATILDVGCAQGALGADYLRRNPRARVLGIDLDPVAAEVAASRIAEVFCGDVEQTPMPFDVPEGIDCIVYGDVLEHMVDPWKLLAAQVPYLKPDGTVLVCMPNVEHWMMVAKLMTGSFDYEEMGLLDRTHLRWFTPRTMAAALVEAGLVLSDCTPRPVPLREQGQKFIEAIAPGLAAIGVDPAEFANRAMPMQYIWRARRSAQVYIDMSSTMLSPQGGVSDVRVLEPLRAMRTDSSVLSAIGEEADFTPRLAAGPRIAVLHRPLLLGDSGLARLRALLAKDYLIISEFDDHPSFMADRGVPIDELLTFRAVHAVQTSTPALAEALRPENPEVAVFANGIFELPQPQNFADPDQMTLFFGAINREQDWAPLMGAINDVARAVGPRLKFSVLHDEGFFNALETPHKTFTPLTDYPTYMRMLAAADIAFMPLADTAFNRAKSDLKFIEAGAARVAVLASDVVYAATVKDGKTGLLFRDAMELRAGLLRYLAYPEAAQRIAEAARAYVAAERMLAYQVVARTAWYRDLWDRREALNEALRARVPALFD